MNTVGDDDQRSRQYGEQLRSSLLLQTEPDEAEHDIRAMDEEVENQAEPAPE